MTELDESRGQLASKPREMPRRGWKEILWRVWLSIGRDNVALVAAGVAFFALLSLFPAFSAIVSVYGLFSSPADILDHVKLVEDLLPHEARELLYRHLTQIASGNQTTLNTTLVVSVLLGIWGASRGTGALMMACNVAYSEPEPPNFFLFKARALLFAALAMVVFVVSALLLVVVPVVLDFLPGSELLFALVDILRWPIVALAVGIGLQALYRYAPHRRRPRWRWVSWGSAVATLGWLGASALFSLFMQKFAQVDETYGAVAGVVILLLWLYVGAYVVVLGAELNAELERQTGLDSTVGPDRPPGDRGAYVADHLPSEKSP